MYPTTFHSVKVLCVTIFVSLALTMGFSAFGENMTITAFGRGNSRSNAIEAAKKQVQEDALNDQFTQNESGFTGVPSTHSRSMKVFKILGVERVGPELYEAQVESKVSVNVDVTPQNKLGVALIPNPNQPASLLDIAVVEAVKERLVLSAQYSVVDRSDPAVTRFLERMHLSSWKTAGTSPTSLGKSVPLNILCFISTGTLQQVQRVSAEDTFEVRTKVVVIDSFSGGTRKIQTLKSTLSGSLSGASSAITVDASNQVVRMLTEFFLNETAADAGTTREISVPLVGIKLSVGESVTIYKSGHSADSLVTGGKVISVGPIFAKIASDDALTLGQHYEVKLVSPKKHHGIILNTDW